MTGRNKSRERIEAGPDQDGPRRLSIEPQPNDSTCGPTALHAVYRHHGLDVSVAAVVESVGELPHGGTLGVMLGCDALARGFAVTVYTCNLAVFDPTWFGSPAADLTERLQALAAVNDDPRRGLAIAHYLRFIEAGGVLRLSDLTRDLMRGYLANGVPLLTGLSSTWLYQTTREIQETGATDDLRGTSTGHFVVLTGYDPADDAVSVADPWAMNPLDSSHYYRVGAERLRSAILLGVMTYDANLVVVERRP